MQLSLNLASSDGRRLSLAAGSKIVLAGKGSTVEESGEEKNSDNWFVHGRFFLWLATCFRFGPLEAETRFLPSCELALRTQMQLGGNVADVFASFSLGLNGVSPVRGAASRLCWVRLMRNWLRTRSGWAGRVRNVGHAV